MWRFSRISDKIQNIFVCDVKVLEDIRQNTKHLCLWCEGSLARISDKLQVLVWFPCQHTSPSQYSCTSGAFFRQIFSKFKMGSQCNGSHQKTTTYRKVDLWLGYGTTGTRLIFSLIIIFQTIPVKTAPRSSFFLHLLTIGSFRLVLPGCLWSLTPSGNSSTLQVWSFASPPKEQNLVANEGLNNCVRGHSHNLVWANCRN